MIQERPVCFDCEKRIDSNDFVFAPPFSDDPTDESAVFHPLCLMRWRERREELQARYREAHAAFMRHLSGECGCSEG